MKRKYSFMAILTALFMLFPLASCGSTYITDSKKYGEWESYLEIPSFMPTAIDEYKVNSYSYTLHSYMDICYEIFVDVSVTEEQFNQLIKTAKEHPDYLYEKEAYYSNAYKEIVFQDSYEIYYGEEELESNVGWADIEKVIYNAETLNIIYVCFHANDTAVYKLDEVAYFNRFSIRQEDYVKNIK